MSKRKAKKQALEQIAKYQHMWHVAEALKQRQFNEWLNVHHPRGISRWFKP